MVCRALPSQTAADPPCSRLATLWQQPKYAPQTGARRAALGDRLIVAISTGAARRRTTLAVPGHACRAVRVAASRSHHISRRRLVLQLGHCRTVSEAKSDLKHDADCADRGRVERHLRITMIDRPRRLYADLRADCCWLPWQRSPHRRVCCMPPASTGGWAVSSCCP